MFLQKSYRYCDIKDRKKIILFPLKQWCNNNRISQKRLSNVSVCISYLVLILSSFGGLLIDLSIKNKELRCVNSFVICLLVWSNLSCSNLLINAVHFFNYLKDRRFLFFFISKVLKVTKGIIIAQHAMYLTHKTRYCCFIQYDRILFFDFPVLYKVINFQLTTVWISQETIYVL